MSPTATLIAALITALFGGGGIAAVINSLASRKKGVTDAAVAKDQTAIAGFRDLAEDLRKEIDRLKTARAEDRERLDRIERQIAVERDLKWTAIQHIRSLYAWITHHIPGVDPPAVPEELAPHVIIPSGKDTP